MKLLGISGDSKTVKGEASGYLTGIMYLIPNDDLCPNSLNAGCREGCLVSAGRGAFTNVAQARQRKTEWFAKDRDSFMLQLCEDIEALARKAKKARMIPCVRLNGTSDITWENVGFKDTNGIYWTSLMRKYEDIIFYYYTKMPRRTDLKNYHLTFSGSVNPAYVKTMKKGLRLGIPMAMVFRKELPKTYLGRPVVDGDRHDLRFLDADGCIVGLKAKGKMRKDTTSGMVVDV
jgi:hypothetical protein